MFFSKGCRIFIQDGALDLNGGKNPSLKTCQDLGMVAQRSKKGPLTKIHYGIFLGDENSDNKDVVYATGYPLQGSLSYKVQTPGYGDGVSYVVYNTIADKESVVKVYDTPNFFRNANLLSWDKIIDFQKMNILHRTIINGPIYRETSYSRKIIMGENNYSTYAYKNRSALKLSEGQIQAYGRSLDEWVSLSSDEQIH